MYIINAQNNRQTIVRFLLHILFIEKNSDCILKNLHNIPMENSSH